MKKLIPLFLILCCCTITYANGSNDANSLINKTDKRFFIENKGQWEDKVHQLAMLPGLNVWITNTGVVYDFYSVTKTNASDEENKSLINGQVVKVTHLNSNEKPIVKIIDKSKSYVNYITGNTSDKCFANAALSREFLLKNIYPGIDQKWYFENDKIRYDYIVNPHGDYRNIEFSISGATDYFIENNELKFVTVFGTVRIADLFVYQTINNTKVQIKARWKKNKNSISFEVENYDRSKPLIIDPLIWSTFIGGSGDDYANDMTMDALGNIYITGKTSSTNFPTTPGVYSTTLGIGTGVVVSKLSNDGSSLIFSTYITQPTTIPAEAKTIVLDHNNNIIIAGICKSDFPVTPGSYNNNYSGGLTDGFVLKLNNLGTGLIFSTYLGGNSTDEINDIAIDSDSDIYIGGITRSANLPVSPGAYDNAYSGVDDGFVAKLSSDGSTLLYLSYLGQSSNENVKSIYVDNNKELVVTGTTSSSNFPTTSGAYSTTHNGSGDIFVSKFNIDATNLVFSTFVGGSLAENAFSIKIGGNGKIFVTGNTTSIDFPVTSNAFDVTHNGMNDIIVFCLSPTFNQLLWATYLGGTSNDYGVALDIDQNNNIIITGETKSINFPTTANAHDQTINSVLEDALVAVLDSLGETLIYSTFLGGSSVDKGTAIKHNSSDNKIYVAGYTYSSNFPTTSGAYSTTHNTSTYDFFVSKFCFETVYFNTPTHNGPICHGDTLKLFVDTIIGVTYSWQGPNGFSSTLQNPFIPIAQQFVHNGVYSVTLTDSEGCSATKSTNTIYIDRPYIYVNNDTLCDGESYHFYASTNDTYLWSGPNGFNSTQGSIFVQNITTNYSGQYTITVTYNGCSRTENFELLVNPLPDLTVNLNYPAITAQATGLSYQWLNCDSNYAIIPGETNPTYISPGYGNYAVIIDNGSCKDTSVCVLVGSLGLLNNNGTNANFIIYPNPNHGQFTIQTQKDGVFKLMDITGKVINTCTLTNNVQTINVNLPAGMYFIQEKASGSIQKLMVE